MKVDFRSLANSAVRNLTPYQQGKPTDELARELGVTSAIKLASNENPLGPSPKGLIAAQAALHHGHIYPDGNCFELKKHLADHLNVAPTQLTIGNGSENILEVIIKTYLHSGDHAVISEYAFLTIPLLIASYGARAKVVKAQQWGHHIQGMIDAIDTETRILFLVNPNNPTGTYTTVSDFEHLLASVPPHVLIVVDQAYVEYIQTDDYPNTLHYLDQYPNLIITRTFSKAYGLAAFRIGYAISSVEIADMLNRARLPFNVNAIGAKAACAALGDIAHMRNTLAHNQRGMRQLESGFQQLNLAYIPSLGNFISVDVLDAQAIYQQLLLDGIIVRPLHAYGMPRHIRVTIGTQEQNTRCLTALEKVLALAVPAM